MSEEHTPETTRRMMLAIVAIVQGVFIFFAAQATVRVFQMRDTISELQTQVARIEAWRDQYTILVQHKLQTLQDQLDRIDQQRRERSAAPAERP
jgi:cyclopropane fatty-acyl-phospholipid synthase-like methyltransferase